jgi:hypothetical protein
MINWKLSDEKEMVIFYADLLSDEKTKEIIGRNEINSAEEALHVADFFWKMVEKSNEFQYKNDAVECEFLLEKIINTLMAYFRKAGYESEWEAFSDL